MGGDRPRAAGILTGGTANPIGLSRMYIDEREINIISNHMALQIANPVVVRKIETLARVTGLTKTAAVEQAVDRLLAEQDLGQQSGLWEQFDAILAQLDQVPDLPNAFDPLEWDERGLPR
jgi:antitoxin VapB